MSKWVKRVLSVILAVVLVGGAVPMAGVPAMAAGGYGPNGKFLVAIDPQTVGTPISTREQLEAIKNNLSGKYYLTKDIDLSGANWVPIGDNSTKSNNSRFTGVFDGQGYVIRNLTISGEGYEHNGLFGYNSGSVKNVGMEATNIIIVRSSDTYVGAVCGLDAGIINNCYNTGNISATANTSQSVLSVSVGGICGSSSFLYYCFNTGNISANSTSATNAYAFAGGISGTAGSEITLCYSYNAGSVYSQASSTADPKEARVVEAYAGGICGNNGSSVSSNGSLYRCYNAGSVNAVCTRSSYGGRSYAGGISGRGPQRNCFNIGPISASGAYEVCAGGITGAISSSSCANNYNIGTVNASAANAVNLGGIIGVIYNTGGFNNGYCLDRYGNSYGTQLTSAQMKNKANFVGFDFDTIWDISPSVNNGYPFLRNVLVGDIGDVDPSSSYVTLFYESAEKPNETVSLYWSGSLFDVNPASDSYPGSSKWHQLSKISVALSNSVYSVNQIKQNFANLGMKEENNQALFKISSLPLFPGYAFGYRTMRDTNGQEFELVVAAFRGTDSISDWLTNASSLVGGFDAAKTLIKLDFTAFVNSQVKNPANATYLFTGHSLGGAMANLFAADYSLTYSRVFGFTFACPKTTTTRIKYGNITNFVSLNDTVPYVPPGIQYLSATSPLPAFRHGKNYYAYTPASLPGLASHKIYNYTKYILEMTGGIGETGFDVRKIAIQCPVDVDIYDSTSKLVGRITNNAIDESITVVPAFVEGDDKWFFLPADKKFTLKMIGTDTGTMDYTVYNYEFLTEETSTTKAYANVDLNAGKLFSSEVGGNITMPNVKLFVTDGSGTKQKEVLTDGTEIPYTPMKTIFSTKYEATFLNWLKFFLLFGWIWMWFI